MARKILFILYKNDYVSLKLGRKRLTRIRVITSQDGRILLKFLSEC